MSEIVYVALPWVVLILGLVLLVLKKMDARARASEGERVKNFSMLGMIAGGILGIIVGFALENVSIWIAPGMMMGLALGSCIEVPLP